MTRRRQESGFALMLVFMMAASIAVMLYMQLPRAAFEAQRGKEELLQDRGDQYIRAIQLYVAKWRSYPPSLDALEKTNNVRFLRRRYKDPMTGKDEWRAVHVNGAGQLIDSIVQKQETKKEAVPVFVSELPTVGSTVGTGTGDAGQNVALRRRPSDSGPAGGGAPSTDPQALGNGASVATPGNVPAWNPQQQNPQQPFDPNAGQPTQNIPGQVQPGAPDQSGLPPGVPQAGMPPQQGMPQPGMPQPGMPQPGIPQPGMPQPGMPQPGMPQQGMPQPGVTPGQSPPFSQQVNQQQPTMPNAGFPGPMPGAVPGGFPPPGQGGPTTAPSTPGQPGAQNAGLDMINRILTTPRSGMNMAVPGVSGLQVGGGIAGFASTYEAPSIKIYNERQKYNEWEFIYDMKKDKRLLGAAAATGGVPQNNNPLGSQPTGSNPGSIPNPLMNPSSNPQQPNPNPIGGPQTPNYPQPGRR